MILSQATYSGSEWAAAGGLVTIVLVQVGKILSDARKDKQSAILESQKSEYLKRIADSNDKALVAQTEVKTTLEKSNEIDRMRHEIVVQAISHLGEACSMKRQQN